MTLEAETVGRYQNNGEAYFSVNSKSQSESSSSVRHAGRDIRVSDKMDTNSLHSIPQFLIQKLTVNNLTKGEFGR